MTDPIRNAVARHDRRSSTGSPAHPSPGESARSPNWGYQLTPERVLAEMQDVGLSATELGPDGFLPADPEQMATVLDAHHLTAVGGFTPVLMHRPGHDPLPEIDRILAGYDATDAEVLVLSAVSGLDGYDSRPILDDDGWKLTAGQPRPHRAPWPPNTACAPCCTRTSGP